jgi:hypothetical protein
MHVEEPEEGVVDPGVVAAVVGVVEGVGVDDLVVEVVLDEDFFGLVE